MREGNSWNHQGRDCGGSEDEAVPEDTLSRSLSGELSLSSFTTFHHRKIVLEKFKGQSFQRKILTDDRGRATDLPMLCAQNHLLPLTPLPECDGTSEVGRGRRYPSARTTKYLDAPLLFSKPT